MNEALLSSKNMNWCTPQDFFDKLNEEFSFTLDAAATDKSAKCEKYYTPETDGLKSPWNRGGGFCILQSAVWPQYWSLGGKGIQRSKVRDNDCPSYPVANGYVVFSRLHIRKSGNPFRARPPDIHGRRRQATIKRQREARASAFPVNGCYL